MVAELVLPGGGPRPKATPMTVPSSDPKVISRRLTGILRRISSWTGPPLGESPQSHEVRMSVSQIQYRSNSGTLSLRLRWSKLCSIEPGPEAG